MSLLPPPLPPPLPPMVRVDKWRLEKQGHDKLSIVIPTGTILTRHETFRLIGELERIGATL